MKTLKPTKTWILICSIIVISSATEHAPSHDNVAQHGDSTLRKKHQNTIVPFGIQMQDHVLSTQDLSCISADTNIFEIMNKAQETCNGTDMRCTFYHFVNHGYENIGTLDINKERFDDLLMKFNNWLLTTENIDKSGDGKTKEGSSLETASIGANDGFGNENSSISTEMKGIDASQGGHIDKLNLSINQSDDDRVHSHHLKIPHEVHHKMHHGKDHNSMTQQNIHGKQWKNENHIKIIPEYNTDHRYFEVYLPKDKVTGKPKTIYVEVDQNKNEFVLLDEEIDKKLNGIKPVRIELDELSEIADTAFNEVAKTSNFKEHVHNHLSDDERAIINDISKYSAVNADEVHLDIDLGEQTLNSINPSVYHNNIYNLEAEKQNRSDYTTENVKEIINVNKNHIVPNKYTNQVQFNIESQIDNITDDMQNDHFELQESNNTETDKYTDFYENGERLDAIEYNENNTFGLNGTKNSSLVYSDISYENGTDTSADYYELSTEHDNVTLDDETYKPEEHNDTCQDIDYHDTHDFSSSNTLNLNEATVQVEKPIQGNKLKSTPFNNAETKLTSSMNADGSQLHAIPIENRQQGHDLSLEPSIPSKPYTTVHSPAYATLDLHAGDSQNTASNSVVAHPSISSNISPLDSVSAAPKISQYSSPIFPSPPVECILRLNKDSKYPPLNFGVSWLPSYSRIEELRLPGDLNPLSLDHVSSPQDSISPLTVPSIEYIGSSQSSPDTTLAQSVPSSSYVIQEPSLITTPCELEPTTPMSPKNVLLSKLGLPKSNTDYERIPTTNPTSVKPFSLNDGVSSPCPIQQIPPCLQNTNLSPIDSGFMKKSPYDNILKETMFPCSANSNRYPYTTIPYFPNPYLKSPQFVPSYLEPLLQTPLQPASKIPTLDSVPTSLDQSNPCLTGVFPQEKKAIQFLPFASNSQFSPLNPMIVGSSFPPALPCPNTWNNIPYLPYTEQNIRNNSPFISNYLTPTADQNHKPLQFKTVPSSADEHPCSSNNILEVTPSSYTPLLPVHTSQVQKDLNPSIALENDLKSLSLKYGIPLSKVLHSLEAEISDGKTFLPTLEVLNSNLKYDGSLTDQQSHTLSKTKTGDDEYRSGNDKFLLKADLTNITPVDSTLIGPHLELENSLDVHNSQSYTVLSETTGPVTTPQTKVIKDSSLIGPPLSTLSSSNVVLSDDNRNGDELVLSGSDSSKLIPIDSSLTGPHLKKEHSPAVLDSHISQGDILTSQTKVLTTSSSQIESKVNQNQPTNLLLDSSVTGAHLPSLPSFKPLLSNDIQSNNEMVPLESKLTDLTPLDISQIDLTNELDQSSIPAKPLLANEIQSINEMTPLEPDLTDLTPLDISEVDFANKLDQSKVLQHEQSAVTLSAGIGTPELNRITTSSNTIEEGSLLEQDLSSSTQLNSSLIGPELKLGSLPIVTDTVEEKTTPLVQDNLENDKVDESESMILPSSLLPTLLNEPVKAGSNLNTIPQDTKLNEELIEISVDATVTPLKESDFKIVEPVKPDLNLNMNTQNTQLNQKLSPDNYVEIPLADTSQISLKDFKIIEPISELLDSNIIPLLSKDSTNLKLKPEMSPVDYEPQIESSLIGTSILPNIKTPVISSTLDSSIQLDHSLVGPSILKEIDSQPPIIETIDQLESSIVATTIDQNIKPLESAPIDSKTQIDSSLIGPTLHPETSSQGTSTVYDSVTQFESSSVVPNLYEAGTETSSVSNAESHLDTTLVMSSLYETVGASASSSASSQLDSSLPGTSLKPKMETLEESRTFDSKKLDSTLVGPHLSTVPFSSDEINMINKELDQKSELANLIPLDSTLTGPHVDFESELDQSEISRYQNLELSLSSDIAPGILETIHFLNSDFVERRPPKSNTVSSICSSDLQELLTKFKNSITKSQLSPSEFKPCDKLLSSIAKQSTDNINMSPTCSDLQTLTCNILNTPLSLQDDIASEYSPITLTYLENELGPIVKEPCLDSNYYSSPQTFAELLPYAQGVPQKPIRPYFPSVPIKQMIDRNWIPQPLNIQVSPGLRPVVAKAPVPSISNTIMPLPPEDLKLLLDLASQSKTFPQLSMPNISTPMKAIPPSLEWIQLSNILPLEKYIPPLPKNNYSILPSSLESSICNPEYTPIQVNDIMSLIDENSYKLLKDMAILPFSQSSLTPSIPSFENGEIVSPSLSDTTPILNSDFMKTRPVLPVPIGNSMVPSSIFINPQIGLYNSHNIPYITSTPNIPPYNLQSYSMTPLDAQFSEMIRPVPKIEALPIDSSKPSLESQWHEIPNTSQLMEYIPNSTLDREFLQQLLSKSTLESPVIQPSSLLDTVLQLSTASNKFKSYPCQSPAVLFTPVTPVLTAPLSNAFTNPVLPMYASPLSVSYAQPNLAASSRLPLIVPYVASPITPLPISPYTASSIKPDFSSPLRPLKSTTLSNYPIAPTEIYNRPSIPYKPSQMYSSPYLPIYHSPLPVENSPYSPTFKSKLAPATTSPISPVFYEPLTVPYFSSKPKSLTNLGTPTYSGSLIPVPPISMASPPGVLPSSYISPDLSTYKYSAISAPVNTLIQPLSTLSSDYTTPVSPVRPILPSYNRPLLSKPMFNIQSEITTQDLENLTLLSTLPISNTNNPFLNANYMILPNSDILPLKNYHEHVPTFSPFSSSQIKHIKPSEDKIQSNIQTTSLAGETPYGIIEKNMHAYSNDNDMMYEKPNFKYPLQSLSYTLAPEEIQETERRPKEDYTKLEDLTPSTPVTNIAFESSLPSKLYRRPLVTPYTPLYGEPLLRSCLTPQLLPHPSLIESLPQRIFDNIPLEPLSEPVNRPVSLPASILSSPLLKPLIPAVNLPLLPSPCIDTYLSPYKILPTDENPLFSTPYYSTTRQAMFAPPIDPRGSRKIISPQLTPAFSQVSASAPFVPVLSPSSPTSPYNLENFIELPLTYNEPKSKKQGTLVPSTVLSYNKYAAPIISHISPLEMPISSQYISPLTPAKSLQKPLISPQYISSILPAQTLQESCILNEAPVNYQPYIPPPTGPSNAEKNIFKSPLVTSPYAMIPSVKMVDPSTNVNSPQWSSFAPKYSLSVSSSPVSKSIPVISLSNVKYFPDGFEPPMTNNIIPSSPFMSSDTDFQTIPLKKISQLQSLPRYSNPSPTLREPLEIVPYETPNKPLGQTILPQNIFKPNAQYYNGKYTAVPLSSSPYLTRPLDSFQTQPLPNVQHTNKPHQNLSPILAQYASPSLAPSYTSLPLETVPNSQINKSGVPQYSLANAPTYDAPIQSSHLARNPFLNQDFKLMTEVPSYPVPNNQIPSLKLTPNESILLSNLRPLDIFKEALESSPIPTSTPLSLMKPLTKTLTQKSRQYQPEMIPINSQYVSQSQIDSVPQLVPSIDPILISPLLKPLLTDFPDYSPKLANYLLNSNIALSESSHKTSLPSASSHQKYLAPSESLVSELPKTLEPMNTVPTTPCSFLKPPFYKQYQSPITKTNMPLNSNYDVQESSPNLPIKGNCLNTVKPIEVSPISASESSRLSLESLDTEITGEVVPYELGPRLKDKFSQSPLNLNQERQFYPALSYLAWPQPTHLTSAPSKYKTAKPKPSFIPSVIPEDVELIDTTDFIPISSIQSEDLTSSYSSTDRKAPILNTLSNIPELNTLSSSPYTILSNSDFSSSTYKQLPSKSITNSQSVQEPDISQFFPYTILSNICPTTSKQLPPTIQKQRNNEKPQSNPVYLTPQEYEELTEGLSSSQTSSSSSPIALPSTNIAPQLIANSLTARPIPLTSLYASPISKTHENLLQMPLFGKYSPLQETPIELTPEKQSIQSLLNKYRPANKITTLGLKYYPYESKSSIVDLPTELDSVKSLNPLIKSKESYVEYIENIKSNDENDYVTTENVSLDENKPDVFEGKSFTESLTETITGVNVPNYYNNNNAQRLQRLSKLDHFYANNHIGKSPQILTAPTFNTSPIASSTDGERPFTTPSSQIYKDYTVIPTKYFGSVPKLDTSSRLSEYYPEIANSDETVPFTNSYTQNYINPSLKSYSQMKLPTNAIEVTDTSEIPSSSYNPFNNIKYSGYKTYQIPSLKSPKTTQKLGTTSQMYSPSLVPYSSINPVGETLDVHQIPSPLDFDVPTEIDKPITSQYEAPLTSLLETKLGLDALQKSPQFNDYYGIIEDEPVCVDDTIENNELKTNIINYINKKDDIKNNLDNNNQELTVPIGNIAITKKEPYNADTIETNNPSIGLKVWKSNVKIAQAELKLKFKDLSVINFMPVVNNLDKYDMEEIRKIVKNYIDEKYGCHIEINDPYTVDNQYTVIKDFDPNAVSDKYNLLWPTNYV